MSPQIVTILFFYIILFMPLYALECTEKINGIYIDILDHLSDSENKIVNELFNDAPYDLLYHPNKCIIDNDPIGYGTHRIRIFFYNLTIIISSSSSIVDNITVFLKKDSLSTNGYYINIFVMEEGDNNYIKLINAEISKYQKHPFITTRYSKENSFSKKRNILISISYVNAKESLKTIIKIIPISYKFIGPHVEDF